MVEIIRRKLTPPPHARLVAETHNEAVISTSYKKLHQHVFCIPVIDCFLLKSLLLEHRS